MKGNYIQIQAWVKTCTCEVRASNVVICEFYNFFSGVYPFRRAVFVSVK